MVEFCMLPLGRPRRSVEDGSLSVISVCCIVRRLRFRRSNACGSAKPQAGSVPLLLLRRRLLLFRERVSQGGVEVVAFLGLEMMLDELLRFLQRRLRVEHVL